MEAEQDQNPDFTTQNIIQDYQQELNLNRYHINFFQILGNYEKVKIMGDRIICDTFCRNSRSYQVFGINEKCEEILIMTAKQEMLSCNSLGYILVYKASNVILGALGYQKNPICCCCCLFVIAIVIVKIVVALIVIML